MPAWILSLIAFAAGAVASIAGFGIGSLLTPALAVSMGTKAAVAVVAVPHAAGTACRFWLIRKELNRRVLLIFGVASAIGGLAGALLHTAVTSEALGRLLGILLLFAGVAEFTGLMKRIQLGKVGGIGAGVLSGAFGGLVGNQGGIRSAALLAFELPRDAFVATATAIALIVDGARVPVYLVKQWDDLASVPGILVVLVAGVLVGTFAGKRLLGRIPDVIFRRVVAGIIFCLGASMVVRAR